MLMEMLAALFRLFWFIYCPYKLIQLLNFAGMQNVAAHPCTCTLDDLNGRFLCFNKKLIYRLIMILYFITQPTY